MEHEIFAIQQERIQVHKKFESAFSYSQTDFAKYRTELGTFSEFDYFFIVIVDKITTEMNGLSQKAIMARKSLVENGKNELASIIVDIQRNEEELLVVR